MVDIDIDWKFLTAESLEVAPYRASRREIAMEIMFRPMDRAVA